MKSNEKLILLRLKADLSPKEVAEKAGITLSNYKALEKGKINSPEDLPKAAQLFNVNPIWLSKDDDEPFPKMVLRDKLVLLRISSGLSQTYVADSVGMSQSTYNDLETKANKTTTKIPRLAQLFGVGALWLSDDNSESPAFLDDNENYRVLFAQLNKHQQGQIIDYMNYLLKKDDPQS
jgi:transcriptional regulator with XRE-family HTH domain